MSTTTALNHLATLPSPSGRGTRAWQSSTHPSASTPLLATASSDKSVSVWSLRDFRLLSTITGGHKRSVRCVQWKDYGSSTKAREADGIGEGKKDVVLATGSFDANVGIWVHNKNNNDHDREGLPTSTVSELDASELPDSNEIEIDISKEEADSDADEEWHFSTLLTGPDSEIKSLAFSPPHYSTNFLATSSRDKSVWVWEEIEDEEWETVAVLGDHTGDVKCVSWCSGALTRSGKQGDGGEERERRSLGSREVLASGSYDDTIRLWRDVEEEGDWVCVGVIDGHRGTVWGVCWEGHINYDIDPSSSDEEVESEWEPRLLSCSDDLSIRVWRRELSESEKEKKRNAVITRTGAARLPSIIRPASNFERWIEDATLPEVHVRSVYAVDWSKKTGLVTSCGGDGTIAVYQEIATTATAEQSGEDVVMNGTTEHEQSKSKWIVVAIMEAAHEEYEINHVCWAQRKDKDRRFEDEEVLVSTADDGDVKIWTLPEGLIRSQ